MIPNPRDKRRQIEFNDRSKVRLLRFLQGFDFALALLILAEVCR